MGSKIMIFGLVCGVGLALLCQAPRAVCAEVIAIEREPKSFFSSAPTMTMCWRAREPKATIVVVLGGSGAVGIKPGDTAVRNRTANMLKILTDETQSKSRVNVVVFDSPYSLQDAGGVEKSIAPRFSTDHLERIGNVLRFYRTKLQTPLWLMGHSNGTISVTAFVNRSAQDREWLAGAILSGSRNEAGISEVIPFPLLFLHHENDGCPHTQFSSAKTQFDLVSSRNKVRTSLGVVRGGTAAGHVCTDGHHMYREAYKEAADLIEAFVLADR